MDAPKSLASIQAWMQQNLIYQGSAPAHINQLVNASNNLTAEQHLGIYQRSYYMRLLTCMREQFPALCYALGEELFNDFARDYLVIHPSDSYTLYELGRRFPDYLSTNRPDKNQPTSQQEIWINFMIDLAGFERQVFLMFDAPENRHKVYATANTRDEDLALQECITLGQYDFAVNDYYHGVRDNQKPDLPPLKPMFIALVRRDFLTHIMPLSSAQHRFLSAMQNNLSVTEALEHTASELTIPIAQIQHSWSSAQGVRQRWLALGFFIDQSLS